ncbi:MAG: ATP-binding cassette domain-containing protein [Spirochaetaceae bacterium]|nr:ATP-binding cassette domain-containing protein [Spirochaetaceae bacterium]
MSFVSVKNLSYSYPDSNIHAVKNVSFSVEKGEYIAVLGSNGSGKSTLAKLIFGFLEPDSGSIKIQEGQNPIGFVQQHPRYQIIAGTVERDTAFGPENLNLPQVEIKQRTQTCLKQVDLLEKSTEKPNTLSLGQTQKLALSGILALSPDLLILDEAVSMIDPITRRQILELLEKLNNAGTTIIHISHDLDEAFMAKRIIVMEDGIISFDGDKEEFRNKTELLNNIFGNLETNIFSKKTLQNQEETTDKEISVLLENINFEYKKNNPVLKNISLAFKTGSITAVMGKAGSGKSTLFEVIASLLAPTSGKVYTTGKPSLAFQDAESALFESVVADDVAFGPENLGLKGKELKERVKSSMDICSIPFEKYKDRPIQMLSGGEKRKVALAGIIAMDSPIIILDEPGAALDPTSRTQFFTLLKELAQQGKTIIFSTHRMEEAMTADRIIRLHEGRISSDSNPIKIPIDKSPYVQNDRYKKYSSLLDNLRNISLGDFCLKKSLVHNMQPHSKILLFFALFLSTLVFQNIVLLSCACGISLIYALLAKYPIKKIILRILKMLPWILIFFVFQVLLFKNSPQDKILWEWNFIKITDVKFMLGLRMILHFVGAMICISVFSYSIEESELVDGMKHLLKPFEKLKFNTKTVTVMILLVMRFIPILTEEASHIVKTQIIREGIKSAKGLTGKIKTIMPIIIPLILQTIKRSENLADALEARYF